ncbi:MAG: hypothetical protein ACI308_10365 [Muribaculaceae bacterium]
MKRTQDDIEFAQMLKANQPKPSENPWFTRKVMNRLPYKQKVMPQWLTVVGVIVCIVLGILSWVAYLTQMNVTVITRADIYMFVVMVGATLFLLLTAVGVTLRDA